MYRQINHRWIIGVLLLLYISIQSFCIHQLTINYDEGLFASYGVTILKFEGNKDIVTFDSKLPVTALNMLPRAVEQLFHPNLKKSDSYADIIHGRYISLLVAIALGLVIYRWASLLYGKKTALVIFIMFLLCPEFLAHGIFVSSDIFACFFTTISFYFLWRFGKTAQTKHFLLASFFAGAAQISKFSMVHLLILFPALTLIIFFFRNRFFPAQKFTMRKLIVLLCYFVMINWVIICATHLFYGMFIPLNDYHFRSVTFQHLQWLFHGIGNWLPVPFPSSYIRSMDVVIYFDHLGGGMPGSLNGPSYILGESRVNGFWYYYFVALLYKLTLPVILLIGLATFFYLKKYPRKSFLKNELFLIIPAIYFLVYMNFFYSTQLGIRHIMIILPLIYIFTGFFIQQLTTKAEWYFCYGLIIYQFISVGLYFPHFLPYTNELILDKKMAYKKIADTNLCYGEGGKYLAAYLRKYPEAKYLPPNITSGKIIMEVNEMLNLDIATMGKYDWVRNLTPADHIHSQYLIFDVSPAMADSLRKAVTKR